MWIRHTDAGVCNVTYAAILSDGSLQSGGVTTTIDCTEQLFGIATYGLTRSLGHALQ
jgi:hypothetical protein